MATAWRSRMQNRQNGYQKEKQYSALIWSDLRSDQKRNQYLSISIISISDSRLGSDLGTSVGCRPITNCQQCQRKKLMWPNLTKPTIGHLCHRFFSLDWSRNITGILNEWGASAKVSDCPIYIRILFSVFMLSVYQSSIPIVFCIIEPYFKFDNKIINGSLIIEAAFLWIIIYMVGFHFQLIFHWFCLEISNKISNIAKSAENQQPVLIFFQNQHNCW